MENLKTCWALSQDLIICKLQLVAFLQKTFHGECDCCYQTHNVQISLLRICSNKCQQSSCFSCWSQLKLKPAIYHQISAKLHRKFPLTVVPLIHGNLSRVSRETFFYFILVCSRNWNHPVLSHMPFAEPLTTAKQILRNSKDSKESFIQSVLWFGRALEFGCPQEAVESFSSLTISAVSPQELPILAESLNQFEAVLYDQ